MGRRSNIKIYSRTNLHTDIKVDTLRNEPERMLTKLTRLQYSSYFFSKQYFSKQILGVKDLIPMFMKKQMESDALRLVKRNQTHQKIFIQELLLLNNYKKAADYIIEFKLDPSEYNDLVWRLRKNALAYFEKNESWMKVEELLLDSKELLGYYATRLFDNRHPDVALSIIKRNNLMEKGYIDAQKWQQLSPYFNASAPKAFKYIENQLFAKDGYAPTEELVMQKSKDKFWKLSDFGLNPEKDIIWIADCFSQDFKEAQKDILSSDVAGIDSEFSLCFTKFDKPLVTVFQIATRQKIYLFDTKKLMNQREFSDLMRTFFEDVKILKIGHSASGDLNLMRKQSIHNKDISIWSYLELSRVFLLFTEKKSKSGLGSITEQVLGKPMSKFEQMSSWGNRPLRKAQMHYAAMDAYIAIKLYDKFLELCQQKGKDIQPYIKKQLGGVKLANKPTTDVIDIKDIEDQQTLLQDDDDDDLVLDEDNRDNLKEEEVIKALSAQFQASEECRDYYNNPNTIRFVIDRLSPLLVKFFTDIGIDVLHFPNKDHDEITTLANAEKRVILTRDREYFSKKLGAPCFLIYNKRSPARQFDEVRLFFGLSGQNFFISNCVHCNSRKLSLLTREETLNRPELKDLIGDSKGVFWECTDCHEVYQDDSLQENL